MPGDNEFGVVEEGCSIYYLFGTMRLNLTKQSGSPWLDKAGQDLKVCLEDAQNDACLAVDASTERLSDRVVGFGESETMDAVETFLEETNEVSRNCHLPIEVLILRFYFEDCNDHLAQSSEWSR